MNLLSLQSTFFIMSALAVILTSVSAQNWAWGECRVVWSPNCNFVGKDLFLVPTKSEDCAKKCLENPRCDHFTYGMGGLCAIKYNGGKRMPGPLIETGKFCGYVPSRLTA